MDQLMCGFAYSQLAHHGFLDNTSMVSAAAYGFTSKIIQERFGNNLPGIIAGIITGVEASKILDPERPMTFKAVQKVMLFEMTVSMVASVLCS